MLACAGIGAAVGLWASVTDSLGTGSLAYLVSTYGGGAGLLAVLLCALLVAFRGSRT